MNNRNHSIDILKFACSILVIFIHTRCWQYLHEFLPVTRCAVPCFFIISGYLLFDKEEQTIKPKRLKRNIIHVIKISFWATLFFIIWKELLHITSSDGHIWIPSIKSMKNWVFLNENPFGGHLWYLFAYLYVLLIILLVNKYNKWKQLYFFVPLLLAPHIILLLSNQNLPSIIYVRNFLFTGLPFFAIGTMIKSKLDINVNKNKRNKAILIACIILFSITSLLERSFLLSVGKPAVRELYISSIVLAICLFLLALSFESKQKTWLSVIGEKESLYIYIFHPVVIFYCKIIFKELKFYELYKYVAPLIVIIVTMILVKCFRWLKILK